MQGLHHHQQLAALLSTALPKDPPSTAAAATTTTTTTTTITPASTTAKSTNSENTDDDDSARLGAINSLHRAILYPPNSLLVSHSASFLSQGFSQLLTDKSYAIRQSAATAYGALCAVICAILIGSNGRQNHVMLGSIVDRLIGWALPLLSNGGGGDGTTELALEGLREFLSVGDVVGIERYALPILKACQELLEDERTSLSLLHRLLGVLTLILIKFSRFFQPHFLDIVDLLLGWVLVPDLAESDRRVIMDSFLQFKKHWLGNLQFDAPISQLRLHPNHLVTGSSAATYIFLLQHGNNDVVQQAIGVLIEEMELLKVMLNETLNLGGENYSIKDSKSYSKTEFLALIKFDLKVLLTSVSLGGGSSLICQPELAAIYVKRSDMLISFIVEKLDPFNLPIQAYVELLVNVIQNIGAICVDDWHTRQKVNMKRLLHTSLTCFRMRNH